MLVIMADRRNSGAEKGKEVFWIGPQRYCWTGFHLVSLFFFMLFYVNKRIEDMIADNK